MAIVVCIGQESWRQELQLCVIFCVRQTWSTLVWGLTPTFADRTSGPVMLFLSVYIFYHWLTLSSEHGRHFFLGTMMPRMWPVTFWEPCGLSPSLSCPSATETWFLTPTVAKESVCSQESWSVHFLPLTPVFLSLPPSPRRCPRLVLRSAD